MNTMTKKKRRSRPRPIFKNSFKYDKIFALSFTPGDDSLVTAGGDDQLVRRWTTAAAAPAEGVSAPDGAAGRADEAVLPWTIALHSTFYAPQDLTAGDAVWPYATAGSKEGQLYHLQLGAAEDAQPDLSKDLEGLTA